MKIPVWSRAMLATAISLKGVSGFVGAPRFTKYRVNGSVIRWESNSELPSLEELSTDPFMKQVSHASNLVTLLNEGSLESNAESDLAERLAVQLSHSDGIRGFFVTYLTGGEVTAADRDNIPDALLRAMEKSNQEDLVSLACMNVIMPTAMVTIHTDAAMAASSQKTAERAKRVLLALKNTNPDVEKNCLAIYEASTKGSIASDVANDTLVKYWRRFFESYGYKEEQLNDISTAVSGILQG